MDNFQKDFSKSVDRIFKLAFIGIIATWVIGLAVLVALGYVAYKVLVHFNIL